MSLQLTQIIKTKLFLCLALLIGFSNLIAQDYDADDVEIDRDSVWGLNFDLSELDYSKVKMDILTKKLKIIKQYNDSILRMVKNKNIKWRSDSLIQLYDYLNGDISTSYNAYSFFAGKYHSNLSGLNKGLKISSFPELEANSLHLTNFLDYTWKRKRIIQDVYISDGVGKEVSRNDVTVSYKFFSPINYCFGFAIIDSKRIQFFPFASFGFQTSTIKFSNASEDLFKLGGGLFDSLLRSTFVNKRGVDYTVRKRELVLNCGAEIDFHLFYSKREKGFIIGLRAAQAIPIIGSGWRFNGTRYAQFSDVTLKDYYLDVVLRIYYRCKGKRGTFDMKNNWWE